MRRIMAAAVASLAIASASAAQDAPEILRLTVDKDGGTWVNEKKLEEKAFDEAVTAAAKKFMPEEGYVSDVFPYITCDESAPFSAFKRVFDTLAAAHAYQFRVIVKGKFVEFGLPKDKGVMGSREIKFLRAQLCSTGVAADHAKYWGDHWNDLKSKPVASRTWIWLQGEPGDPVDVDKDPKAIARVAKAMCDAAGKDPRPSLVLAVDPNVPVKHFFALLVGLNGGEAGSVADEAKSIAAGEPVMHSNAEFFQFAKPEEEHEVK